MQLTLSDDARAVLKKKASDDLGKVSPRWSRPLILPTTGDPDPPLPYRESARNYGGSGPRWAHETLLTC